MGEIINLRRARKAKARAGAAAVAATNRVAHGRTNAEKTAAAVELRRCDSLLDGAAIDRDGPESGAP